MILLITMYTKGTRCCRCHLTEANMFNIESMSLIDSISEDIELNSQEIIRLFKGNHIKLNLFKELLFEGTNNNPYF
jgi:hypothetical protein